MDKTILLVILSIFGKLGNSAPQYGEEHEEYGGHEIQEPIHHKHIHIPIVQSKHEQHKEGYQFSYKTGNGIHVEEAGYLKKDLHPSPGEHPQPEDEHPAVVMHGKVSYTGADGVPITLTYVADEHGFQAQGAHLPTPPPLPAELQKAYDLHNNQVAHTPQVEHKDAGAEYQEDYGAGQYTYH